MKKLLSLLLALMMVFSFAACTNSQNGKEDDNKQPTDVDTSKFSESFNIGFLKGPTGIGAAQLMSEHEAGNTLVKYNFTLEADARVITSALISGELDAAAVPTNVAATLYNKTEGQVKIIAVNTLGVLHILEKGDTIKSIADLEGKTIYATGQGSNPEYVLNYILTKNGLTPGENVTVEYLASDELQTKMASGEIDICMLPVPAATTVLMKNKDVRDALNLTDEWGKVSESTLTQGCIVARTEKFDSSEIAQFLKEYEASIKYMADEKNIDNAASLAVKYEIVPNEQVAKNAIPQAGLTYMVGAATMKGALDAYFDVLFGADPKSIGGAKPADDIYFEVK